jgi:uncharacterized protein YndB with AHSA1/START domain
MLTISAAPIRKMVRVKVTQTRAFALFTQDFGKWWPASHSIGKSPLKHAIVEQHAGGRWYEVGEDGSQCEWGKVLEWQPPNRILLAWQINSQWQFDADLLTEIEVRFHAEGEGLTRVELEHRFIDRYGERTEAIRGMLDAPEGWSGILGIYAGILGAGGV